ncbi:uncharacterized protein LOC122432906 [Cervus canadensis]|uniref:uncharacterized protein LOC122432906 n=1 Tax=Cervus canadensis TaxID=1574408 RepID=UPI001CA303EF|nr:uncharacterized protein LOC122432906 [Cervus canadensis]
MIVGPYDSPHPQHWESWPRSDCPGLRSGAAGSAQLPGICKRGGGAALHTQGPLRNRGVPVDVSHNSHCKKQKKDDSNNGVPTGARSQHLTHLNYGSAARRGAPPGTLEIARKHRLRGRPDIPGCQVRLHLPPALTLPGAPPWGPPFFRLGAFGCQGAPTACQSRVSWAWDPNCVWGRGGGLGWEHREPGIGWGPSRTLGLGGDAPRSPVLALCKNAHAFSDSNVYLASLSNVCSEPCEPPNSGWK